jgi:hypothetical protein
MKQSRTFLDTEVVIIHRLTLVIGLKRAYLRTPNPMPREHSSEKSRLKNSQILCSRFQPVFLCELLLRRLARKLGAPMGHILFLRFLLFVARDRS